MEITRQDRMCNYTHKVISKVSHFNFGAIYNRDTSNATKYEIFQGLWASWATIQQAYTCFLKGSLSLLTPYSGKQQFGTNDL